MRTALVVLTVILLIPTTTHARDPKLARAPYLDRKLPVERRAADLLSRMTAEEKLAQLYGYWVPKTNVLVDERGVFTPDKARTLLQHGIGQIARPSENEDKKRNLGPRAMAELTNAIQKFVVENTRLGIPVMFHEEGLHGMQAPMATSFPQPIALAASFDPALVEEAMGIVALEIRSRGAHHALGPVVDVARDPRWGRTEETFGEDPFLVGQMGAAVVRGYQGGAGRTTIDARHVVATAKHFAVHSQPEAGMNAGPNNIADTDVRNVFLPPFFDTLVTAGALSVMPSYNEVDGIPSHANRWLLRDVLRGEWKWNGLVVSDYDAVEQLHTLHGVAQDLDDAARIALDAGVDIELPNPRAYKAVAALLKAGTLPRATVDAAVLRVLRLKLALGLFEDPFVDPAAAERISGADAHGAVARKAAERSLVLLKNDGKLLPLSAPRTVAVIGPNAAPCRLGGYSGVPPRCVGILDGIKARAPKGTAVLHAQGCWITKSGDWWADKVQTATADEDAALIRAAVETARRADVVVLALGDSEQTSREAWSKGHLGDRPSIDLFGRQPELARAVLAVGKPTVLVLINGRPPAIPELAARVPAILEGFYLGQETGHAVAAVLFGDVNPGGKLPITFARSAGHLPAFYNHKPSARRGYLLEDAGPVFPFGHGLSYTTFAYGKPRVEPAELRVGQNVTVAVEVTNSGARAGDEVVQLYLRDAVSSVTRPVKELRGFQRVTLAPGEKRTVTFTLGPRELGFWKDRRTFVVEPGKFDVTVGGSSVGGEKGSFVVVNGKPRSP